MYCSKCGYELQDGTNFCRKCGSKNIFNNLITNEKKSTFDVTASKDINTKQTTSKNVNTDQITSKNVTTKQTNSKETNSKQKNPKKNNTQGTKHKGFIVFGVLIILLSVGFGSYYISISKFFSDKAKDSAEVSKKKRIIPMDDAISKVPTSKPDVTVATNKTDISNINSPEYYIFPKSDTEKLLESDVSKLNKENLILARNEIFARHGFVFKTEEYKSYFTNKSWYKPNPAFKGFDGELNAVEVYNINFIKKYEIK